MRTRLACLLMMGMLLSVRAQAQQKDLSGNWDGEWAGVSGASGKLHLELQQSDGAWKCSVTFTLGADEYKTKIKACKVEGAKLEARYEFDLQGAALESTISGERKDKVLEGSYRTVSVANGGQVDEGTWKAGRE